MRCARSRGWRPSLKETLRLHPPLIILMRVAKGEFEVGGLPDPRRATMVAASPAISNRIAEDFPDPDAFDPGRYVDPRQEDLDQPLDLDPVRRRPAPLRRRRVRHDADQGDLLGSAARLRVRDGTAIGDLPQRPLEDGGAAGPARQGALPRALGGDSTGVGREANHGISRSKSTWTSARVTRCARSRRPTTSKCPSGARSKS